MLFFDYLSSKIVILNFIECIIKCLRRRLPSLNICTPGWSQENVERAVHSAERQIRRWLRRVTALRAAVPSIIDTTPTSRSRLDCLNYIENVSRKRPREGMPRLTWTAWWIYKRLSMFVPSMVSLKRKFNNLKKCLLLSFKWWNIISWSNNYFWM